MDKRSKITAANEAAADLKNRVNFRYVGITDKPEENEIEVNADNLSQVVMRELLS